MPLEIRFRVRLTQGEAISDPPSSCTGQSPASYTGVRVNVIPMLTEKAPGCAIVADSPGFLADTRPPWRFLGGYGVAGFLTFR
jgi:hypothetical protein